MPLATLLAQAGPAKGASLFAKRMSSHTINSGGANGIGPNLHGSVGKAIGQGAGGFAFSSALKGMGGTWTFEQMGAWLKNPKALASGTKMTFAGMGKPEDRAAMILYLNDQGSNVPLPPPPPPEPSEEPAAGEGAAPDAAADGGEAAAEAVEAAPAA